VVLGPSIELKKLDIEKVTGELIEIHEFAESMPGSLVFISRILQALQIFYEDAYTDIVFLCRIIS
jgi:hypothetical protein